MADGDGEGAYVRLAHEAMITYWTRARRQIDQDREDLRTRAALEEALSGWRKAPKGKQGSYLLRDPLLASARDLSRRWSQELEPATKAFIRASQRRAYFRMQFAIAASMLLLLLMSAAGFLWLDGRLSQVRFFLQNAELEAAQAEFAGLARKPLSWVLPVSDSAKALATQFLDTGLTRVIATVPVSPSSELGYYERGQLLTTRKSLFALFSSPTVPYLVRCDRTGANCQVAALGQDWRTDDSTGSDLPALVHDRDDVYLVSRSSRSSSKAKEGLIAPIPDAGALTLVPRSFADSGVAQLKLSGERAVWISSDEIKSLQGSDAPFSESPPIALKGDFGPSVPSFKAKPENQKDAEDIQSGAVCDDVASVCVVTRYLDARSTIRVFDIWERDLSKADEGWSRTIEGLFQPPPSRNEVAVSRNGEWIAIGEGKAVTIWHRPGLSATNRQTFSVQRLGEIPTALTFDESNQELLVLTRSRLLRMQFEPRAEWTVAPHAFRADRETIIAPIENTLVTVENTKVIKAENLRSGEETLLVEAAAGSRHVRAWPDTSIVTVTYGPDGTRHTIIADLLSSPPALRSVEGGVLLVWHDGQLALLYKAGCDLVLWRANGIVQPVSIAQVLPGCAKYSDYTMRYQVGVLPRGRDGAILIFPDQHVIKIELAEPMSIKIAELDLEERKLVMEWRDDRLFYLTEKGDLVMQTARMGFRKRHVALPAAIEAIVQNTARDDNPTSLVLHYLGDERYLVQVDGGKCENKYNVSLLLIDAAGETANVPFLLQCVNGLPADPKGHNVIWGMTATGASDYFGNYHFDGIFQWSRGRDLVLYAFEPRNGQSGAVATRADLDGPVMPGTVTRKVDLSKLHESVLGMGATEIVPSSDGRMIAFFRKGTGSGQTDQRMQVLNLDRMKVDLTDNKIKQFFDYVSAARFSPNGRLLLTTKTDTGYELFKLPDLTRVSLPPGVIFAEFTANDRLRLVLASGGVLTWHVPEGIGGEFEFAAQKLR